MSTIFVVDDVAIFREPIAASLRLKGSTVVTAANGREVLSLLASQIPDLILLDVAMPEMDGIAVLKALRAHPAYQSIPVILLTAVAERDYVLEAGTLGVRDYLLKSRFSLDELVARTRRCLEGARASALPPTGVRGRAN